ncbi:hypothetical protein UFOVP112_129 [uncultured Caudovirales phage]|uniref:Uncharacterized protein n=1 Tax=uncultured Caudovirales phage TaxID=2100421 RepID=A0A6J5L6I2_9CAUD|nr:hypothetical protein UFOVP112_129 [uncultured Caudovirales phage]
MNLSLTRDCIVDGLELTEFDNEFNITRIVNRDEFCNMVDQWKSLLLEKYDAKPGQTFFLHGHSSSVYYSFMFAAWELGLINIIDLPRCNCEADLTAPRTTMFGIVDFIVRTNTHNELFGPNVVGKYDPNRWYAGPTFKWEYERARTQSRNIIELDDFEDHVPQNDISNISNIVLCTTESDAIYFPSSGTSNAPRVLKDSHKKVLTIANRSIVQLGLQEDERVLHQNNINHGSTFVVHWLPTFMKCKYHFTAMPRDFDRLVKVSNELKINRVMLYTTKLVTDWLIASGPVDHPVKIQTLYQITPEIINLIKEKNINTVFGNFGSSEIGGPFFVKRITPNVNLDTYEINNMGKPLDDFWQLEVRDGKLWIKSDILGIDWATANDKFEQRNGDFYFLGRENFYRIGEEWFDLGVLEKQLAEYFKDQASIVVDPNLQKLYLAIWEENKDSENRFISFMNSTFSTLHIDYIIRGEPLESFSNGRKIDTSLIRDYCRNKLGIIEL